MAALFTMAFTGSGGNFTDFRKFLDPAQKVKEELEKNNIRVELNADNKSLGGKIRESTFKSTFYDYNWRKGNAIKCRDKACLVSNDYNTDTRGEGFRNDGS